MQYTIGSVSVTNGSAIVTGTGTLWATNSIAAGHGFTIVDSGVSYTVATVNSETQITLSSNYSGSTLSGLSYAIFKDFTSPDSIPEISKGDIETSTIWTRAVRKIQDLITGIVTGTKALTAVNITGGTAVLTSPSSVSVNSASTALTITQDGTGDALVVKDVTGDGTPFVIRDNGNVIIGHTTGLLVGPTSVANIQLHGSGNASQIGISQWFSASTQGPRLVFSKSRSDSIGTYSIVQSGDTLGEIRFYGDDGTDILTEGARIVAYVDGTPGANDMPTRMVFLTTPDGSSTPAEAMQITSGKSVVVGNAAIATAAADGFLYITSCAGAPTGTPTTFTGRVPVVFDTTNARLYYHHGGAWHYSAQTA